MTSQERDQILTDMLHSPEIIHVVLCNYQDGSQRAFTFSDEVIAEVFVKYIMEAGEELGVRSYQMWDTFLDALCDGDYNSFSMMYH